MRDKEALIMCILLLIVTRWVIANDIGFYWAAASTIGVGYYMRRLFKANVDS
jgi:hypothetical protein